MKLVVDANEFFSGVIAKGKELQSKTLDVLFSDKIELFAPLRLLAELENNRDEIRLKSGFSSSEFDAFTGILKLRITFLPLEEFLDKLEEAKELPPHPKDLEYFALALKLDCAIWSEEKAFKKQSKVKILSTSEVWEILFSKQ